MEFILNMNSQNNGIVDNGLVKITYRLERFIALSWISKAAKVDA